MKTLTTLSAVFCLGLLFAGCAGERENQSLLQTMIDRADRADAETKKKREEIAELQRQLAAAERDKAALNKRVGELNDLYAAERNKPKAQPAATETTANGEPVSTGMARAMQANKVFENDQMRITLTGARVRTVPLKGITGNGNSQSELLMFDFTIENLDDRRMLNPDFSTFVYSKVFVSDDVENTIRGVDFGFGNEVIGAIDQTDIEPGKSKKHLHVSTVPPPKTKWLAVEIDLERVFGYSFDGRARFTLDANEIANFK